MRYNAEKKKLGNYYSTPIWSFRFKCHLCNGRIEIQTDPQVRGIRSGCRAVFLHASVGSVSKPRSQLDEGFADSAHSSPQNTRYVVTEGAKQKMEEWDPAENGQMVIGECLIWSTLASRSMRVI